MESDNQFRSLKALNRALIKEPPYMRRAGRIVLGAGPVGAAIAFVGEQPGDQEDRQGTPFVGPAGMVLAAAMAKTGVERSACYLTNAVKQFKYIQRGKKRLHQRPTTDEIGTALFALANRRLGVTEHRGPLPLLAQPGFVTIHPSAILRVPERNARHAALRAFEVDLKKIRRLSSRR